jgi:putative acetyltransferase
MTPDDVSLAVEDPTAGDAATLIGELITFITELYPEDEDEPPMPWTAKDIAPTFVVARVGGVAAGCGALVSLTDGALEVVRIYVRPDFRGLGVADRVLARLEDLARDRGARVLMLRCGPRQPHALKLYERNGYVRRQAFAYHREDPTNIFYEKALTGGSPSEADFDPE